MPPVIQPFLRHTVLALMFWVVAIIPTNATVDSKTNPASQHPLKFAPEGGVFIKPTFLRLEVNTPSSVIRFTLDGTEPSEKSPAYSKELEVTTTLLVRARAFEAGKPVSATVSHAYTFLGPDLEKFTSNLPLVIINTFGHAIERENKIGTSVRFIEVENRQSSLLRPANFDGHGEINLRGNTSLRYLKRSFTLKTRDDAGKAKAVSILGFPEDSDWVLYAPYPDKTLLRDVLAYDLSRQIGRHSSRTRFVEVFLNQVGGKLTRRHHMGVYVLEEKIKRSPGRVNIQKLTPENNAEPAITGGYIFKKDHWDTRENVTPTVEGRPSGMGGSSGSRSGYPTGPGGFPGDPKGFLPSLGGPRSRSVADSFRTRLESILPPGQTAPPQGEPGRPEFRQRRMQTASTISRDGEEAFRTSQRNEFFYVEPKQEEITPAQKAWLQAHLNEFEKVLHSPDFRHPTNGYAAYIDVGSFIDHHLIVEVTKNIDGFRFSTFYQKDRGGKIKMEPIWDWNLSFGNCNGKQGWIPEYWYWPQLDDTQYTWFRRLFEDPDFGQRYVDRWGELRATVFSPTNMVGKIDALVAELGEARARNFQRWPILGRPIWPNKYVGRTYEDEINFMKDFIQKRLAWIDAQFVAAPIAQPKGSKDSVALTAVAGHIFYTLDGSDPRSAGGNPAANALRYSAPAAIPSGGKIFARAQHDGRWSPPLRY